MAFFCGKTLKKIGNVKKKYVGALTYLRMLTDLRQVLDVTGSGAKMAQMGGNGVFFWNSRKRHGNKNRKNDNNIKMIITLIMTIMIIVIMILIIMMIMIMIIMIIIIIMIVKKSWWY